MLIAAWIFGVLSAFTMAMARSLFVFVIGVLMYGITLFVVSPLDSYLTAARGKWSVGRVITFSGIVYNSGVTLGPSLGGWIGDQYGLRTIYAVAACVFVLSTVFIVLIESQPRDHHDPFDPPAALLTNKRYLGFLLVFFLVALAVYLPQPFTPNFLENQRGLSLKQIGNLGSIGGLGTVTFNFLLGMLEARTGFLLGQIGVAAYALLLWKGTGFGSPSPISCSVVSERCAVLASHRCALSCTNRKWDWHMASPKPSARRRPSLSRRLQVIYMLSIPS
jgi:MFS family permease